MIFIQVASSEWFLRVQIQKFENLYNVEIRNEEYCCCDAYNCKQSLTELQGMCMTDLCQPYFVIQIRDSSCNGACSLDKTYHLNDESNSSFLDEPLLSIPFKEMEFSDNVSTKSNNY